MTRNGQRGRSVGRSDLGKNLPSLLEYAEAAMQGDSAVPKPGNIAIYTRMNGLPNAPA